MTKRMFHCTAIDKKRSYEVPHCQVKAETQPARKRNAYLTSGDSVFLAQTESLAQSLQSCEIPHHATSISAIVQMLGQQKDRVSETKLSMS